MNRYLLIIIDPEDNQVSRALFDDFDSLWKEIVDGGYDVYTEERDRQQLMLNRWLPGEDRQRQVLVVDMNDPTWPDDFVPPPAR